MTRILALIFLLSPISHPAAEVLSPPPILTPLAIQTLPAAPLPPVLKETLANGMRVLILERHTSPTIAFHVFFDVGSVNDVPGKSGLAHLFEHMAFKGTRTINSKDYRKEKPLLDKVEAAALEFIAEDTKTSPDAEKIKTLREALETAQKAADEWMEKDEYERIYSEAGAEHFNAFTASDYTAYVVSLPSNRMDLWMAMESDRFKNPVLREFYRERDVVMEERRMNYESAPDGKLRENFISHAFMAHPYKNEGIGWMDDLRKLTVQDARDYFASHYGPSKAVVVIVGDVRAKETLALFRESFASLPKAEISAQRITREPPQEGERRIVVRFAAEPKFFIGYHKPDIHDPDQPVFEMISSLLGSGRTSRFYKNLVEGKQLAQSVDINVNDPGDKYPGLVFVQGIPRAPHTADDLERGIYEELEKLKTDPLPGRELQKVRNQLETGLIYDLESNEGMGYGLGYYETVAGDWSYPWKLQAALAKVGEEDIHRVAKAVFVPENRTVATLLPPSGGK